MTFACRTLCDHVLVVITSHDSDAFTYTIVSNSPRGVWVVMDTSASKNITIEYTDEMFEKGIMVHPFHCIQVCRMVSNKPEKDKSIMKVRYTVDEFKAENVVNKQAADVEYVAECMQQVQNFKSSVESIEEAFTMAPYLQLPFIDAEFMPQIEFLQNSTWTFQPTWRHYTDCFTSPLQVVHKQTVPYFRSTSVLDNNNLHSVCQILCRYPSILANVIQHHDRILGSNETFKVRLCVQGQWTTILLDGFFPSFPGHGYCMLRTSENNLSIPLLQKSFAKLHGGYTTAICSKTIFENVTGAICVTCWQAPDTIHFEKIVQFLQWQKLVIAVMASGTCVQIVKASDTNFSLQDGEHLRTMAFNEFENTFKEIFTCMWCAPYQTVFREKFRWVRTDNSISVDEETFKSEAAFFVSIPSTSRIEITLHHQVEYVLSTRLEIFRYRPDTPLKRVVPSLVLPTTDGLFTSNLLVQGEYVIACTRQHPEDSDYGPKLRSSSGCIDNIFDFLDHDMDGKVSSQEVCSYLKLCEAVSIHDSKNTILKSSMAHLLKDVDLVTILDRFTEDGTVLSIRSDEKCTIQRGPFSTRLYEYIQ